MLRMRTKVSFLTAALTAALFGANSANANITLSIHQVPLATTAGTPAAQLAAAGFSAYVVTATADPGSAVGGFDFSTGAWGITGTIHQRWSVDPDTSIASPSPTGNTAVANPSTGSDSFFTNGASGVAGTAFEDNTGLGSPVSPNSNFLYGLGTTMKLAANYVSPFPAPSADLAYIVAKNGTTLTVFGDISEFVNNTTHDNFVNQTIVVGQAVPEPASMGVLALGGLALLSRRRRKA